MQGTSDSYYKAGQLLPENFLNAARTAGFDEEQVRVRGQNDYDHSYYFVSNRSEFSTVTDRLRSSRG
jgi:S-formylglutathione hydrolase